MNHPMLLVLSLVALAAAVVLLWSVGSLRRPVRRPAACPPAPRRETPPRSVEVVGGWLRPTPRAVAVERHRSALVPLPLCPTPVPGTVLAWDENEVTDHDVRPYGEQERIRALEKAWFSDEELPMPVVKLQLVKALKSKYGAAS